MRIKIACIVSPALGTSFLQRAAVFMSFAPLTKWFNIWVLRSESSAAVWVPPQGEGKGVVGIGKLSLTHRMASGMDLFCNE